MKSAVFFSALIASANAHGRLIKPIPRVGDATSYENDPVGFKLVDTDKMEHFVCRHETPGPRLPVNAGDNLEVQWDLTAAHPGDCSFYISYDVEKTPLEMEWFKVANLMDCKAYRMHQGGDAPEQWEFTLPSWLPAGPAVLRWEWSALHIPTSVEFFVQCVDLEITATGDEISKSALQTYKVYDPVPARPESYGTAKPGNGVTLTLPMTWEDMSMTPYADDGTYGYSFRSAYNYGANWPYFMTGPECAQGMLDLNNCALTAPGTQGWVDMSTGATPVELPTNAPPSTTTAPVTTDAPNTDAPVTTEAPNSGDVKYPFYFSSSNDVEQRKTMVNIAGLLSQCMWESGGQAPWSACDENNYTGLSTASCTQRGDGQLYADLGASDGSDGSCPRDNSMTMTAETAASWTSGPMKCMPGGELEGCCWWGRGAIQTTGRYNYGQLQRDVVSKLGLYEQDGSPVDLCQNPEAMCQHDVLKMTGAMYYWTSMVQKESCFNDALTTTAQNFDLEAAPSAGCYNFGKGVGGAINNGIWNSYPHGNAGRIGFFTNLMNAIEAEFNKGPVQVNANARVCSGDEIIDTLLENANIESVSQLDQSTVYNWNGFCASLRAFLPNGDNVVVPSPSPVTPAPGPVDPTPAPEPVTPTPAPQPGSCPNGSIYEMYAQCGGDGFVHKTGAEYEGCPVCPEHMGCYKRSQWFSGCTEVCPGGDWLCASEQETTTEAPATPAPVQTTTTPAPETTTETTTEAPATTTTEAATTETTGSPSSCPNAEFATCGGEGQVIGTEASQWSGETCCQAGLTCVVKSQWYHVCEKPARRLERALLNAGGRIPKRARN